MFYLTEAGLVIVRALPGMYAREPYWLCNN